MPDEESIAKAGEYLSRLQEAWMQFQRNKIFRRWAHKEYLDDMKLEGNPDIPKSMILEAYDLWRALGQPNIK